MTPEQYSRVKAVFIEAIALPDNERIDFVRSACSDDLVVQEEVASLLLNHSDEPTAAFCDNESFRPDSPLSENHLPTDPRLLRTIQFPSGDHPDSDLTLRFKNSTRLLLRDRLLTACWLIIGLLFTAIIAGLFSATDFYAFAGRLGVLITLLSIVFGIRTFPNLSLKTLRQIELVVVFAPVVELLLFVCVKSPEIIQNQPSNLPLFQAMISWATATYISLYGTLIPSNWRRTAIVTTAMALTPLVLIRLNSAPSNLAHIGMAMLLLMAVAIATAGAHVVHRVRREALATKLFGQYQIVKEIGRGGMGVVYLAKHNMLTRPAAIKLIRLESAGRHDAIKDFEREVQICSSLTHWNTVQIFDYGVTERGEFYYAMEYLSGESLKERLDREGALTLKETLRIVIQICDGLREAHERSYVHRDIKPGNIFLAQIGGEKDVIKILDFGLAISPVSQKGKPEICGTPAYMAPEQIQGGEVNARTDIYAIGCLTFQCLTGRLPFDAKSPPEIFSMHLHQMPDYESLHGTKSDAKNLLESCLEKRPGERCPSVVELKHCAEKILNDHHISD